MQKTSSDEQLKHRIIHSISDDEEYVEEIFTWVNFDIEERPPCPGGILYYRAYKKRYRLTEILEALTLLERDGLVASRQVQGYNPCCGLTARMFRLTDKGEQYWENCVRSRIDELYDDPDFFNSK